MLGMNSETGRSLGGADHLRQSMRDILTTPLGSRIMRRDYGSRLPELVDRPLNADTVAEIRIATVEALARWEPRIAVEKVTVEAAAASGRFEIGMVATVRETGEALMLEGVVIA